MPELSPCPAEILQTSCPLPGHRIATPAMTGSHKLPCSVSQTSTHRQCRETLLRRSTLSPTPRRSSHLRYCRDGPGNTHASPNPSGPHPHRPLPRGPHFSAVSGGLHRSTACHPVPWFMGGQNAPKIMILIAFSRADFCKNRNPNSESLSHEPLLHITGW